MVTTRRRAGFAQDYPLFQALAKHKPERVAELCRLGQAAVCGPGNVSPLHVCALLGDATSVPALVAAGAPLDAALTLGFKSPELASWLSTACLGCLDRWRIRHLCEGTTPLKLALLLSQGHDRAVAMALIDAGADAWPIIQPYSQSLEGGPNYAGYGYHYRPGYVTWVLTQLAGKYQQGQLEVTSQQLGALARLAYNSAQSTVCTEVLRRAAAQNQPGLDPLDANRLLGKAVEGGLVCMAEVLLQLGATPGTYVGGNPAAVAAALHGHAAVMLLLLQAGAPVTTELVTTVISRVQPDLLEALLQHGPLPVPTTRYFGGQYTCPVLNLLRVRPKYTQLRNVLQMAEMLAAAGYRPTVYRNMASHFSSAVIAEYDPLKAMPESYFELEFSNRYTLLPFRAEGWTPDAHHKYPPALRAAFRALLLVAARGSRMRAQLAAGTGEEEAHRAKRLKMGGDAAGGGEPAGDVPGEEAEAEMEAGDRAAGDVAGGSGRSTGCLLLGQLPDELMLRIFHLAARPLSAWIMR